jgi:hypothetical protein
MLVTSIEDINLIPNGQMFFDALQSDFSLKKSRPSEKGTAQRAYS